MQTESQLVVTQGGVVLPPEVFESLLAYAKHFIRDSRAKLDEYRRELARYGEYVCDGNPQEDAVIAQVEQDISRAEAIIKEVELLRREVASV
jgi:hypothetical protein